VLVIISLKSAVIFGESISKFVVVIKLDSFSKFFTIINGYYYSGVDSDSDDDASLIELSMFAYGYFCFYFTLFVKLCTLEFLYKVLILKSEQFWLAESFISIFEGAENWLFCWDFLVRLSLEASLIELLYFSWKADFSNYLSYLWWTCFVNRESLLGLFEIKLYLENILPH
jgi:hypothetical protein